jgi:hypothetical protein
VFGAVCLGAALILLTRLFSACRKRPWNPARVVEVSSRGTSPRNS